MIYEDSILDEGIKGELPENQQQELSLSSLKLLGYAWEIKLTITPVQDQLYLNYGQGNLIVYCLQNRPRALFLKTATID